MSAALLAFPQGPAPWSNQERADVYRAFRLLTQQGAAIELVEGAAEDGAPWFAFVDAETGESILHLGREGAGVTAVDRLGRVLARGRDMRQVIDQAAGARLAPVSPFGGAGEVFAHPATGLAALVISLAVVAETEAYAQLARLAIDADEADLISDDRMIVASATTTVAAAAPDAGSDAAPKTTPTPAEAAQAAVAAALPAPGAASIDMDLAAVLASAIDAALAAATSAESLAPLPAPETVAATIDAARLELDGLRATADALRAAADDGSSAILAQRLLDAADMVDARVAAAEDRLAEAEAALETALAEGETTAALENGSAVLGGDGDDVIAAGDGDDVILSGAGADLIDAGDGDDVVFAGVGSDVVLGGDGDDLISAGDGDDVVDGGDGNDVIQGGAGDDVIATGAGDDVVDAGDGDDVLFVGDGHNVVDGGDGRDLFVHDATNGVAVLRGGEGINEFVAESGDGVYVLTPGDIDAIYLRGEEGHLVVENFVVGEDWIYVADSRLADVSVEWTHGGIRIAFSEDASLTLAGYDALPTALDDLLI